MILGMKVHATTLPHSSAAVCEWAERGESRYVCVATVNNVMEAFDSTEFRTIMNQADLVTPDGMPLVWSLRLLGHSQATRVYGPDLTPVIIAKAAQSRIPIGFYGASPNVLSLLIETVRRRFPDADIAYTYSPPFRPLSMEEDQQVIDEINRSRARILFVGLSTPKQEWWMASHKGRVHTVTVGVGAAFDFIAGTKAQAPRWVMRIGMEWFFRLLTEPTRLWKRYLKHNPRFAVLVTLQLAWRVLRGPRVNRVPSRDRALH